MLNPWFFEVQIGSFFFLLRCGVRLARALKSGAVASETRVREDDVKRQSIVAIDSKYWRVVKYALLRLRNRTKLQNIYKVNRAQLLVSSSGFETEGERRRWEESARR